MKQTGLLIEFMDKLKEAGFKVFVWEKAMNRIEKLTWCFFSKNDNIGTVQCAEFGGLDFGTVHKPCKESGTGFRTKGSVYNPTIKDAEDTFVAMPKEYAAKKAIFKYKGEWMQS